MKKDNKNSFFEPELNNKKNKPHSFERFNINDLAFVFYDILAVSIAYFLALWFRFDCLFSEIPREYLLAWANFAPIYACISVVVFWFFHLYQSMWKYVSFVEFNRIACASVVLGIVHTAMITLLFRRMPISYYVIGTVIQFVFVAFGRFAFRLITIEKSKSIRYSMTTKVMLIGAGDAGRMILRDLQNSKNVKERVCCIIDDNTEKQGRYLYGVPIVGGREDILLYAQKYKIEKIYLAMPGASADQRRDILDICKETNCQLKSLPGIEEIVSCEVKANSMRDVSVEDLLGRAPVKVNMDEISQFIKGKIILVTGGGGSIGSELCRQIAKYNPEQLIVFDIYENNAHAIGLELRDKYPKLNLEVLIGSVRDSRRINQVFEKYKPDVVYHAAAHKHVP